MHICKSLLDLHRVDRELPSRINMRCVPTGCRYVGTLLQSEALNYLVRMLRFAGRFFEDVADYACRALTTANVALSDWLLVQQLALQLCQITQTVPPESQCRLVGNPNSTLPQIATIFAKAEQ